MQFDPLATDAAIVAGSALLGLGAHATAAVFARRPLPISPALVAALAGAMAALALLCGVSRASGFVLGWALLTLAIIDAAALRLPDAITLPLVALGLVFAGVDLVFAQQGSAWPILLNHLTGAVCGYAVLAALAFAYRRARGRVGLGLGDAKLAAAAGAWLGAGALPATVLIGCAIAFAWVATRLVRRGRETLRDPLPFGPPLAAATWIMWLASGH
jgi:leader peptidase (prepilin peptidase)/N-methyltransferase